MKAKDIAKQYDIDLNGFESYLRVFGVGREGFSGGMILDDNIEMHVDLFKRFIQDGVDPSSFKQYLKEINAGIDEYDDRIILDESFEKYYDDYRQFLKEKADETARKQREEEEKQIALANMLITSGFSFEGYRITKYSGYISGDDAIDFDPNRYHLLTLADFNKDSFTSAFVQLRKTALKELKEAAYALGCNAVIGVDFDYITAERHLGQGMTHLIVSVTANGNAVCIEKDKD